MPELHHDASAAPAMPPPQEASAWPDEADFALGCECAVPALQIEAWREQSAGAPETL